MALSKAGTGAGALLCVSSTVATLASPASAPTTTPTKWTLAPTSTPTGLAILQMKSFTMPAQKYAFDEITNTNSPTIGVSVMKENVITVLDPGEATFTGVFIPTDPGIVALQTAFATGIAQQFQVQLPLLPGQSTSGNVYEFNAWVAENPQPTDIDASKAITVKVTLKLSSLMTYTVGS